MENNLIVLNELGVIKQNIIALREEFADMIFSRDDLITIENYKKEKENNLLVSHEKLKKELENAKD